ncbi:MAG: glutamate--cysteine ligase [Gammaproteobacteria bacterium]|nr:glutamate--cysteine ligase [Gammaproteobacteria bacterium]
MHTPVPSLRTTLTGPLLALEKLFLDNHATIEHWIRHQLKKTPPPFYASVDIRNAGFKIAPVDTNLFPAGFNNLNLEFMPLLIQATATALSHYYPWCQRLLLVPENHTRNPFYWQSLTRLYEVLYQAGYEVRVASWKPLQQTLHTSLGKEVPVELLERRENKLVLPDFIPCAILLNNDLSEGVPDIFKGITQVFLPPLKLGWASRLKSHHFSFYRQVSQEFAEFLNVDPWLINPYFTECHDIDFMKKEGEPRLATQVDHILSLIKKKYQEYHIDQKPFVIIKADSGTYGMGIMTALSAEEVTHLNRKQRSKMSASKSGKTVEHVLIQEGVYTQETWGEVSAVAEPVVYMMGSHVVGGFYRIHQDRGPNENLNAPGMRFEPLAFTTACNHPHPQLTLTECPNRFYAYGVIARLALIAASRELAEAQ